METTRTTETEQITDSRSTSFSQVELEVLQLVSEGRTNTEIANILKTSVRTVETRRAAMMEKSGTTNAASLIKYAVKNNLIT
jgi:two-component system response regulator NreC